MADSKLSALTPITSLSGDELFYVVDDDDGTPTSAGITVENLAAGLAARTEMTTVFAPIALGGVLYSAGTTLTNTTPNNTATYQQWGTEEAVIAQADCPTSAVVVAALTGGMRPGPGSPAVGDRGGVKLQVSFDGGGSFADMGNAPLGVLFSTTANRDVSVGCNGRATGTVTGDIQVRAMVKDIDQANDTTWSNGVIVCEVHPQ